MNDQILNIKDQIYDDYLEIDPKIKREYDFLTRYYGSHQRVEPLLKISMQMAPSLRILLFKELWSSCDDTLGYTEAIRRLVKSWQGKADFRDLFSPEESIWFEKLPDPFRVYRGCDATGSTGLSWTTSRLVAQDFAIGHRGICHKDPIVITGLVRKMDVLFATDDRDEQEVLVEFDCIKEKRISSYRCNARGVYSSRY